MGLLEGWGCLCQMTHPTPTPFPAQMILDRMQYLEVAEVPAEVVAQAEEDVRVSTLLQRPGDVSTAVFSHLPLPSPSRRTLRACTLTARCCARTLRRARSHPCSRSLATQTCVWPLGLGERRAVCVCR